MPRDDAAVLDIARAARLVLEFTAGLARTDFDQDLRTQSAVLHRLLVMGEAVKPLPVDFRDANPGVPWALIAGMRDKLIHVHDEVDLDEVWSAVQRDVPDLLRRVEPLLPAVDG